MNEKCVVPDKIADLNLHCSQKRHRILNNFSTTDFSKAVV